MTFDAAYDIETREREKPFLILTEQVKRSFPLQQYLERQGFQAQVLDIVQTPNWLEELLAVRPGELGGFFVSHDLLGLGVEANIPFQAARNVAEMAECRAEASDFDVGVRKLA